MAYIETTIYVATKAAEWELEIYAEGYVTSGGSNRYGSDEPAWTEVEIITLARRDGRPLPRLVREAISDDQINDIAEALANKR